MMGWVEIPKGRDTYFFNEETRQTTFIPPRALVDVKLAEWRKKQKIKQGQVRRRKKEEGRRRGEKEEHIRKEIK